MPPHTLTSTHTSGAKNYEPALFSLALCSLLASSAIAASSLDSVNNHASRDQTSPRGRRNAVPSELDGAEVRRTSASPSATSTLRPSAHSRWKDERMLTSASGVAHFINAVCCSLKTRSFWKANEGQQIDDQDGHKRAIDVVNHNMACANGRTC